MTVGELKKAIANVPDTDTVLVGFDVPAVACFLNRPVLRAPAYASESYFTVSGCFHDIDNTFVVQSSNKIFQGV